MASFADLPALCPARVLLRAPNWLGDCVMALPAMRVIGEQFPEARITVATRGVLPALFAGQPWCSDTVTLEKGRWRAGGRLQQGSRDLCVLFPNSFGSALEAVIGRIPVRIGYASHMRSPLLSHPVGAHEALRSAHQIHQYMRLALVLRMGDPAPPGADPQDPPVPVVAVTEAVLAGARGLLQPARIDPDSRPFVLAPGAAGGPAKRWPEEHYAALAQMLYAATGKKSILTGAPGDLETCEAVVSLAGESVVSLCGKTSLPELMGLLSLAGACVGNDSGASHLAAAVGAPTTVLFGPTSMTHTVPVGRHVSTMNLHLDCAPCRKRICPLGHRNCLRQISPESVMAAVAHSL